MAVIQQDCQPAMAHAHAPHPPSVIHATCAAHTAGKTGLKIRETRAVNAQPTPAAERSNMNDWVLFPSAHSTRTVYAPAQPATKSAATRSTPPTVGGNPFTKPIYAAAIVSLRVHASGQLSQRQPTPIPARL